MDWERILEWSFYGSTVSAWAVAAAVLSLVLAGLLLARRVLVGQLRALAARTNNGFTAIATAAVASTRVWFLLLLSIRAASLTLPLPERGVKLLEVIVIVGLLLQFAVWGNAILRQWLERYTAENLTTDAPGVTTMRAVVFVVRLVLWAIVLLLGLDNLGVNVTALIAGLGVGGIAVALAAQNILGDAFSSLSIVMDKPFVVGDFVVVDEYSGTVDRIGLKTTRLRGLGGEQLVFSNSDLLKSRIRNYRHLQERRIAFSFGVEYETALPVLEKIPEMVHDIVRSQELTRFDRAHFKAYGDSALEFECVYFVLAPEFNRYMDIQQAINFELFRRFASEGIGFAYRKELRVSPPPLAQSDAESSELRPARVGDRDG